MNNFSQIFVVGDIHGCHIFLTQIHKKILDQSNNTSGNKLLIYLGDYIDRGPKIKETIQALLNFQWNIKRNVEAHPIAPNGCHIFSGLLMKPKEF